MPRSPSSQLWLVVISSWWCNSASATVCLPCFIYSFLTFLFTWHNQCSLKSPFLLHTCWAIFHIPHQSHLALFSMSKVRWMCSATVRDGTASIELYFKLFSSFLNFWHLNRLLWQSRFPYDGVSPILSGLQSLAFPPSSGKCFPPGEKDATLALGLLHPTVVLGFLLMSWKG